MQALKHRLVVPDYGWYPYDLNCRGLVVVSDAAYPGWKASLVDGVQTPLYEAYGTFRAVLVPAGNHRIEMDYRPASVRIGMLVTLTGILTSLLLLWLCEKGKTL